MAVQGSNIQVGADINGLLASMTQASNSIRAFADQTRRSMGVAQQATQTLESQMRSVGNTMKGVGTSLSTYVTAPLTLAAGAALKAYGDYDALKRGVAALDTQGQNLAGTLVDLREVAKLPGLGFQEAIQGYIRLRAVGVEATVAKNALTQFGNAIALTGGGKNELDRITVQLGQLASKGVVLSQDLRPIIEAAPSVATALQKMFGTVDSETISKALKAAGKSSTDFIKDLTKELQNLPRATGGIKNAFENIADSAFTAAAAIGEIADKNFELTDFFTGLSDKINQFVEYIQNLSPETQKVILVVAGLAAAIGPLTLAVGGIITLLPTLAAGFAAITGPVGLVVVAIAGAAFLIVSNWDAIKASLKETGIWDSVVSTVQNAVTLIKTIFNSLKDKLVEIWNKIKSTIIPIVEALWKFVTGIFKNALDGLSYIMRGFTKVFQGDWKGIKDIVLGIFGALWNSLIDLGKFGVRVVGNLFAGMLERFGATTWADGLRKGLEVVASEADKVKFKFEGLGREIDNIAYGDVVELKVDPASPKPTKTQSTASAGKSEEESLKNRIDALAAAYAAARAPARALNELIDKTQQSLNNNKAGTNPTPIGLGLPSIPNADVVRGQMQRLLAEFVAFKEQLRQEDFSLTIKQIFADSIQSFTEGIGEMIGGLVAGTASFSDVGKFFLSSIAGVAQQWGKALIAFGVASEAIQKVLKNPFNISNPYVAIAAGVGLLALGGALKASISKTSGSVGGGGSGGGGGASFNNLSGGNGVLKIEVTGTLEGRADSLVALINKRDYREKRIR